MQSHASTMLDPETMDSGLACWYSCAYMSLTSTYRGLVVHISSYLALSAQVLLCTFAIQGGQQCRAPSLYHRQQGRRLLSEVALCFWLVQARFITLDLCCWVSGAPWC